MAGSGHAGRGRPNDHVLQDAGDRDLFHQQHPYTPPPPPPRFSSPSRPPRRTSDRFTSLAYGSAVSTLVQAAVWVALSVLAIALYYNYLSVTDPGEQQRWSDWAYIIVNLYFNAKGALPSLPSEGLATPSQMQLLAMGTLAANGLMLVMSVFLLIGLGCCSRPGAVLTVVVTWALSVVVVTAADVVVAAAMVRDLLLLEGWNEWPGDYTMLRLCPGAVLALALRGGVLLLANVVCMLLVLRRLHEHRKQAGSAVTNDAPQTATTKDGPIDGFLYPPNGDREGVLNPVFVPDDAQQQQQHWTTFKPEQQRGGQRANGHSGHDLGFNASNRHDIGFNPNNRHDLGFNPNNRHDIGYNANNRHDLGYNGNNRHDLGYNGNNRHDIGYNGNNRHDLGFNPISRHDLGMDDPEDTSHLMWMEEVDKHVDVHVRRGEAEDRQDRPPQHHRHGFVEERQPQPQPQPRRRVDEQRVDEHFPSGRFRAAFGTPLNPGALPVGYPEPGLGLGLARVPLTPTSYRPPSLPPVDYSPPARRRGAGAAEQALVAGRAGLRPVNQERF